jgi:oligoendopeptidase F
MRPQPLSFPFELTSLLLVAAAILPVTVVQAQDQKIRERSEVGKQYLWATEAIYPTDEAWEADFKALEAEVPKLAAFKGKLGESPATLLSFFKLRDDVSPRLEKNFVYASLRADEDTRVNKYQGFEIRLRGLGVKFGEATAWVEPELTSIPWETLERWMNENKELGVYRHALENLFRQKKHILPAEQEKLIALAGQVFAAPAAAYNLLANADLKFPTIKDADGKSVELSDSAFYIFMDSPDRRVRKDAYEGITGTYKSVRNTAAALLNGDVQEHIFSVKARGYDDSLAAALDPSNIPVAVYDNLVKTVNANLPLLHRYTTLRRKALKCEDGVHDYDLYARLTAEAKLDYTYEQAVDTMLKALAPLGADYCAQVKKGVDSRWIDVYPTKGKQSGAYSSGTYLTQPYILLNYYGKYSDLSTLCHEMGHSMHSFLSRSAQPYVYADYDIFCAEVASTANEILLQDYILEQIKDPQVKLYLLGELLEGFRGTVFRQTMFSEFEQAIHEMAEKGEPLTADSMGAVYGGIMKKYYGPDYTHDELVDNYWIRIPHFYRNFYVYKYATSYCAASNIVSRIAGGEPDAVAKYLGFLKGGSSKYPLELLKGAGVDMTTPKPIEDAMKLFEKWINEAEELLGQKKA